MESDCSFTKPDVYARVTDEIIRAIEAGAGKYEMPWHRRTWSGPPKNASTGNSYHGVNVLALWSTSQLRGYYMPHWATFLQWEKLGAKVRRGQKATRILFYKREEEAGGGDGAAAKDVRHIVQNSQVFNAEQVDGWEPPELARQDQTEKIRRVDDFIDALGADIRYGPKSACYDAILDCIHMPNRSAFIDRTTGTATEGFYSVLLHEHVHWSGADTRLNRDLYGSFGDHAYAMEELVAELGAAFLCADLGLSVQPRKSHAAYVANWLSVLGGNKTAIFTAANAATAACRYLSELSEKQTT